MSHTNPPDIEIYLAVTKAADVLDWLAARFPEHQKPRPAGKRQWRQVMEFSGHSLPILVIEEAAPGFTSLWIDSAHSPWPDDMSCAREAFAHFGCEIRATAGSWTEDGDPDTWWSISQRGEAVIHWPE